MSPFELRIFDFVGAHPVLVGTYLSLKGSFFLSLLMYTALVTLLHLLAWRGQRDQLRRLTAGPVALMTLGGLGITFAAVVSYFGYMFWRLPEPRVVRMLAALARPDPWPWRPLLNFVPSLWVLGLTAVWIRHGRLRAGDLGFRRPDVSARTFLAVIGGGWLAIMSGAMVWSLILPTSASLPPPMAMLEEMRAAHLPGPLGLVVTWAVLVSVSEEIFFRGVIYGALRQYLSVGVALPIESLLFALAHGRWHLVPLFFLAGCVLTYLYEWKGSLYVPILAHLSAQAGLLYLAMT